METYGQHLQSRDELYRAAACVQVEMDTAETDAGSFADDLKKPKRKSREHLISADIGAEFGNKHVNDAQGYLLKALKYL